MKREIEIERGEEKIEEPRYVLSVAAGDRYDGSPCRWDRIGMDKRNWLLGRKRIARRNYTTEQLQGIIAGSKDMATLIGASLVWVGMKGSEDIFKDAADLAGASSLDDLWCAYNTICTRNGFVAVVIAIVHYELLSTLEVGEYYPSIEIVEKGGEFFRKYGQLKRA